MKGNIFYFNNHQQSHSVFTEDMRNCLQHPILALSSGVLCSVQNEPSITLQGFFFFFFPCPACPPKRLIKICDNKHGHTNQSGEPTNQKRARLERAGLSVKMLICFLPLPSPNELLMHFLLCALLASCFCLLSSKSWHLAPCHLERGGSIYHRMILLCICFLCLQDYTLLKVIT